MVELVIYVCSKLSMILAPVLKKINLCLSKRNVLASKVFAHGFLSGVVQKCSGGTITGISSSAGLWGIFA